jgi:hypothetical protein
MALAWQDVTVADQARAFGPLALIAPLLQRLGVASIIDQHLPPDPQLEFSHGRVLSLLLAARLCQPTALVNVPTWAEGTGADKPWGAICGNLTRAGPRGCGHRQGDGHPLLLGVEGR